VTTLSFVPATLDDAEYAADVLTESGSLSMGIACSNEVLGFTAVPGSIQFKRSA